MPSRRHRRGRATRCLLSLARPSSDLAPPPGAVVAKLLLVPACNLALVVAVSLALPATDPLVLLIMTVLGASPAAMNMRAAIPPLGQTSSSGQTMGHTAGPVHPRALALPRLCERAGRRSRRSPGAA